MNLQLRIAKFWARVDKTPGLGPEGTCWQWTKGPKNGYGQVWWGGRLQLVHRVCWELSYGPIPEGMLVCHRCDNPPCVRPSHLFLGTHGDNARDAWAKGRASLLKGQVEDRRCRGLPEMITRPIELHTPPGVILPGFLPDWLPALGGIPEKPNGDRGKSLGFSPSDR